MTLQLNTYLAERLALVNDALDQRLPVPAREGARLEEALRYAVLSGGKRLRPIFAIAVAEMADAAPSTVLDAACAVEMAHAASLILDDLPCMDNAVTRRGQPCTHVHYGTATALLACVGLLAEAYRLVASNAAARPGSNASEAVTALSEALGPTGLVMGQHLDLTLGGSELDRETVERVHHLKAGALFILAARLPAILLDFAPPEQAAVAAFAQSVGLAFQIGDDLIDARSAGEDDGRPSFAGQAGTVSAQQRVDVLIQEAEAALAPFGDRARRLIELADHVRTRTS